MPFEKVSPIYRLPKIRTLQKFSKGFLRFFYFSYYVDFPCKFSVKSLNPFYLISFTTNCNLVHMIFWSDKILRQPQPRSCFQHGNDFVYADYLIRYTEAIAVRNKIITFHLTKPVCADCLDFQTALLEANHGQIEIARIEYPPMTPKQRAIFNCGTGAPQRYRRAA